MAPKSKLPNEFELIARYFSPLARGFPGAFRLLDDVAVIAPASGKELVVKTDTIVSGVDFFSDAPADLIARKALRVNLSDLAAKGAVPRAYLLDLALPDTIDETWVAAFAGGLAHDQGAFGVHLIGGDMSSTSGPSVIAASLFGEAPIARIVRRDGARSGDAIFVTGTIGDAALGLLALGGTLPALAPTSAAFLVDRYGLPQPRVDLGPRLIDIATSAIDVSDGLVADLHHLCAASRFSAVIESTAVPLSPAAHEVIVSDPRYLEIALTGGDDYEILFTAPETAIPQLAELSRSSGVAISPIGHMIMPPQLDRAEVVVLDGLGRPLSLASEGWTHFR
jgi:thiamine-monophosphate kinase